MVRGKVTYAIGDAFAVPLPKGGFAAGIIAAADGRGQLVAYFFGPRHPAPPSPESIRIGSKHVWAGRVGDLGFLQGRWKIVGHVGNVSGLIVTSFRRRDIMGGGFFRDDYDPSRIFDRPIREERTTEEKVAHLPESGLAGAGFVEERLDRLLPT